MRLLPLIYLLLFSFFCSCGSADLHTQLDPAIPPAKMRDAKIEKQLVDYFNEQGWDEKFKAAIITSKEYRYKKSYAGIITDRTLVALMVSVKPDGTCMYQDFTVGQPKIDTDYGSFRSYGVGSQASCSCEGLK